MKLSKQSVIASVFCGALVATSLALPPPILPRPGIVAETYSNCGTIYGCNNYLRYKGLVDPLCCAENATHCQDYEAEEWTCAAGNSGQYKKYKNLKAHSPIAGSYCGSSGGCGETL
jgi:hypothetical protein